MPAQTEEFFQAIRAGSLRDVIAILNEEPEVADARSGGIQSALFALYFNETAIASVLADLIQEVDIFTASGLGLVDRVEEILDGDATLANAVASDGFSPLGLACFFGRQKTAAVLLQRGAEVNRPADNPTRVMPIHSAAAGNHPGIVLLLLENGAQVNARQQGGFTPLHAAAQNNNVEMVSLLIEYGADVNARTDANQTPLGVAKESGAESVGQLLVVYGATA